MRTDLQISNINSHKEEIKELFKAAISVDCAIFAYDDQTLKILCIHSELEEYAGLYSLVGDLVHPNETLEGAANRILEHRTGLTGVPLRQVKAFGDPQRHPAGRVITIAFFALIDMDINAIDHMRDRRPEWVPVRSINTMAFDHAQILKDSIKAFRERFFRDALYADLLPEKFTLSDLQKLSEEVLQKKFDKRNFRKKMLSSSHIEDTQEMQKNVNHRPAKLFRISQQKIKQSNL